jgi:glycosyltransferase involved in cell wall biosynthesis
MLRLHEGLKAAGAESNMLVGLKTANTDDAMQIPSRRLAEFLLRQVTRRLGLNDLDRVSAFGVKDHPLIRSADIVHIHCIHGGFFSYLALPGLATRKATVFTFHDMWPFTGHCIYSYECERWRTGCGSCPHPETIPPISRDTTAIEWRLKARVYRRAPITVITPSTWLTRIARASRMLAHLAIHHIPYGLDTDAYRPLDRGDCRRVLGLRSDAHVLVLAATTMDDRQPEGYRKGGDLLVRALMNLPSGLRENTQLLIMGAGGEAVARAAGRSAVNLGFVQGDRMKAIAYSAADVLVFPTRADNMPLVLLEAMACGTPLVSFAVGGVPDMVRPGVTGELAAPEDATGLAAAIVRLLNQSWRLPSIRENCRSIAVREYSLDVYVARHLELYRELLAQQHSDTLRAKVSARQPSGADSPCGTNRQLPTISVFKSDI